MLGDAIKLVKRRFNYEEIEEYRSYERILPLDVDLDIFERLKLVDDYLRKGSPLNMNRFS